jgi:hypothetical protein
MPSSSAAAAAAFAAAPAAAAAPTAAAAAPAAFAASGGPAGAAKAKLPVPPKKLMRLVGQAIRDWRMVEEGDRLVVGLSGGKDSLTLLFALLDLQRRAPVKFTLAAATVRKCTPRRVLRQTTSFFLDLCFFCLLLPFLAGECAFCWPSAPSSIGLFLFPA